MTDLLIPLSKYLRDRKALNLRSPYLEQPWQWDKKSKHIFGVQAQIMKISPSSPLQFLFSIALFWMLSLCIYLTMYIITILIKFSTGQFVTQFYIVNFTLYKELKTNEIIFAIFFSIVDIDQIETTKSLRSQIEWNSMSSLGADTFTGRNFREKKKLRNWGRKFSRMTFFSTNFVTKISRSRKSAFTREKSFSDWRTVKKSEEKTQFSSIHFRFL